LLRSALLARNTVWNLSGKVLPLLAGLVSIPIIIKGFGVDRFGLLSIAWMVVGDFSIFDMGLGQSRTKLVERLYLEALWFAEWVMTKFGMANGKELMLVYRKKEH